MIDLYYWPTPNGHKITFMLEELGVDYTIHPINISDEAAFTEAYLKISPNHKMPAIVDNNPVDNGAPIALFESGEILFYLAEKYGKFLPSDLRGRHHTLQWLFWQMAGFGPMLGQNHHFVRFAKEDVPYAKARYVNESRRLYAVLDKQLSTNQYIAGDELTIADMASYPWALGFEEELIDTKSIPNVIRWLDLITARPSVKKMFEIAKEYSSSPYKGYMKKYIAKHGEL